MMTSLAAAVRAAHPDAAPGSFDLWALLAMATQGMLITGAVVAVLRWRWAAVGLVLFLFKAQLPVVLDYWMGAFSPREGDAALERWHALIQVSNLVTAGTLLMSLYYIIRRESRGAHLQPQKSSRQAKRRPRRPRQAAMLKGRRLESRGGGDQ